MRARLSELKLHMLPSVFSLTGDYTERQLDRARGYRLLVHAEIESYLEDVSRDVVINAIREWKADQKPTVVIVSFLAAYHSGWSVSDEVENERIIEIAKSRVKIKDSVSEIIDLAQTQFTNKIKNNHGIKDKNFKTLVLPAGVDVNELDSTWLANLDSFGSKRGDVAHKTMRATGVINPKDEYDSVQQLLIGLKALDLKIWRS